MSTLPNMQPNMQPGMPSMQPGTPNAQPGSPSPTGDTPGPRLAPPTSPQFQQTEVRQAVIDLLRQTKPWVRFLSVLGFIACGLMALGGVLTIFGGLTTGQGQMLFIGLMYVVMTLLYFVPSLHLGHYASSIGRLVQSGTEDDLEEALGRQRAFWKFVGIMVIVMICLYALIFVGALLFGVAAAAAM